MKLVLIQHSNGLHFVRKKAEKVRNSVNAIWRIKKNKNTQRHQISHLTHRVAALKLRTAI